MHSQTASDPLLAELSFLFFTLNYFRRSFKNVSHSAETGGCTSLNANLCPRAIPSLLQLLPPARSEYFQGSTELQKPKQLFEKISLHKFAAYKSCSPSLPYELSSQTSQIIVRLNVALRGPDPQWGGGELFALATPTFIFFACKSHYSHKTNYANSTIKFY